VVRTKWAKFPRFVEYANAYERFQEKTPANMRWARDLSIPLLERSGGSVWSAEHVWETLYDHQPTVHQYLDAIIESRDNPERITRAMMQRVTDYCADIKCESRWDGTPAKIREQEAQQNTLKRPAQWAAVCERLAALWDEPVSRLLPELPLDPPPPVTPPDRYHETWTASHPLAAIYWDLREFFQRSQPERLRKCPVCQRFFVQVTKRVQTYCDTPCRLKANLTRRERNAEYRRRYEEQRIRRDLRKVQTAKDSLGQTSERELQLSWVLQEADISKRRWTTLRQWEIAQYGKPQVTDLTRRVRPLARSS
jgi:hypothetical protein